ncbi:MAG: TetR/AcrR family transcriptional regulator [Deltaproteobacteria bacterium]|nr:TetR/AcrR family transcriptional regulator [Deltaproteobacteria bacterium]
MRRAERRALLLASALDVFARKGYHATSIADIIRKAGVARGTFYLYFEGKRAVFDELLNDLISALNTRVKRIDPSRGPAGVVAQMESNVDEVLGYLLENRPMLRVLLAEAVGLDPGFDQKLSEFYGRLLDMIQHAIELGNQMKLVVKVDTQVAALCILGSIKEVLYQQAMGAELPARQVLVNELLRYNVRGLFVAEVAERLKV